MLLRVAAIALLLSGCKKAPEPAPPPPLAPTPAPAPVAVEPPGRGDAAEYEKTNAAVIAQFETNCAFEPVIPDEEDGQTYYISECRSPGDPTFFDDCTQALASCGVACTPPCMDCGKACTVPCDACKAACGKGADAGACIHACAVTRQHCRHDCWDALTACRRGCSAAADACRAAKQKPQ